MLRFISPLFFFSYAICFVYFNVKIKNFCIYTF